MRRNNTFRPYRDPRPGEIGLFLSSHGIKSKVIAGNHRINPSPCCGHNNPNNVSFSLSDKNGLWRCFHEACGKAGNWYTFTVLVGYPLSPRDRFEDDCPYVDYLAEWTRNFEEEVRTPVSSGKYPELLKYCHERRISSATLDAFRVVSKGSEQVRFPIFAWADNKWNMVNSRVVRCLGSGTKNFFTPAGGPTHFLIGNHLLDPLAKEKRAIIFEGQWDVMSAYELGLRNVFSLPNGASIGEKDLSFKVGALLQYIPDDWEIYVAMDMDDAGNIAAERLFQSIGADRFARLHLPYKDLNDWHKAKPDLTAEEVLATAKGLVPSLEVKGGEPERYVDFFSDSEGGESMVIVDTPYELMTEYLSGGFYEGQTTGLLAASGAGKTTLVNQIAIHTASRGVKCGLISLEDTGPSLKSKLRRAAMGTPKGDSLGRQNLKVTQLDGPNTTHQAILDQVERFVSEGCRVIIVDNLDFISVGVGQDKVETNKKLLRLAVNFNVHIICVWQPNKVDLKKPINSFNQKGSSVILQDSSNYINVNRHQTLDDIRIVQVEKCRQKDPGSNAKVLLSYVNDYNIYEAWPHSEGPDGCPEPGLKLLFSSKKPLKAAVKECTFV